MKCNPNPSQVPAGTTGVAWSAYMDPGGDKFFIY